MENFLHFSIEWIYNFFWLKIILRFVRVRSKGNITYCIKMAEDVYKKYKVFTNFRNRLEDIFYICYNRIKFKTQRDDN